MASTVLCAQQTTMQTLGQALRARRLSLGFTLEQVAASVLCTKSYLSTIENGYRTRPSQDLLRRLEQTLCAERGSLARLCSWQSLPKPIRQEVAELQIRAHLAKQLVHMLRADGPTKTMRSSAFKRLENRIAPDATQPLPTLPIHAPIINTVRSGYPDNFHDLSFPAKVAEEYASAPGIVDPLAFAIRVTGNAMAPAYNEGDIVVCSPAEEAASGMDCFVRLQSENQTNFRRIYFNTDAENSSAHQIRLQPLNNDLPPSFVKLEDVAGLYPAVCAVKPIPTPQRPHA